MQAQIIIDRFLRSEKSLQFNLKPIDKLLLFFLASYMGCKDTCFPSYETLMTNLGIGSRTNFKKSLDRLCNAQIIYIERRYNQSNIYTFNSVLINDVIY